MNASTSPCPDARPLRPVLLGSLYAAGWAAVGLLQAIAELQHYLRNGGRHAWEPFLWELSSAAASAVLAVGVYRLHRALFETPRAFATRAGAHLLGAIGYVLAHSALMYGLRGIAYVATGVAYQPGSAASVLAYEGAKDLVSYAFAVALSHGVLLFLRDRRQRARAARLDAELAAARLARLQDQVQPHFLFNTLNLVSSVMYESVERADRILAELSDLLRLSLAAGARPMHTLADELRLVEPFLSIMGQRFGDRLTTRVEVEDAARGCQLPSLLLMAPIENAVKHGVAQSLAPVTVRLSARVREGRLEVVVSDSAAQVGRGGRAGGIGLANTRERLAAIYGDAATLTLSRENEASVFRMTLPAT